MKKFTPDLYYKNIFEINYKKLKKDKIKYIFFDVDNTILPYTTSNVSKEVKDLFNKLKKDGFVLILMSNSGSKRINKIKDDLKIDAYTSSFKPLKKNYKKVLKKYNKHEIIFVGDQIITDVFGAKRNDLKVILLDRLDNKEPLTTRINRIFERFVIKINKFERGKYYE